MFCMSVNWQVNKIPWNLWWLNESIQNWKNSIVLRFHQYVDYAPRFKSGLSRTMEANSAATGMIMFKVTWKYNKIA